MLQTIDAGERRLAAYGGIAPDALLAELDRLAGQPHGLRVLHLNATPYGGGVAEPLRSVVPLLRDLGLVADWKVLSAHEGFFRVTKTLHNALQGAPQGLSAEEREIYLATAAVNARLLVEQYDVVFVHDAQPAAVLPFHGRGAARWVWRCHIDTSQPNPDAWAFLRDQLGLYDAAVFTMAEFVPPGLPIRRVAIIPPAIDPLSPKNLDLPDGLALQLLDWIGVRPDRPLVTQVARLDPWKDPLYRLAREEVPSLQLALVGSMALDDPEGWDVYRAIEAEAADDPLIHVFSNLTGVGNIEVNAFQRLSDVVVQKSIREGFGLVVSEALWKGTPVVAGRAGGIPLQLGDGVGGLLVDGVEDCARAILRLLRDPEESRALGQAGRARVREHFLLPRLLLNELTLIHELVRARPLARRPVRDAARLDPVCGLALARGAPELVVDVGGRQYAFCSRACRARFLERPAHYTGGAPATEAEGAGRTELAHRRGAPRP